MPDLTLNGRTISYTFRRSARRSVGLAVSRDGLRVTAPQYMPLHEVQAAIHQKAVWILAKVDHYAALPALPAPQQFISGEQLPYRGGTLTLSVGAVADGKAQARRDGATLHVRASAASGETERVVRQWYGQEAVAQFTGRLNYFIPLVGKGPRRVTVKEQHSRWGSCSANGNIALCWRLVLAPPAVADFVIVHELCHLHRLDHSPEFWALVAGVLPSYRQQRQWLRQHGDTLVL